MGYCRDVRQRRDSWGVLLCARGIVFTGAENAVFCGCWRPMGVVESGSWRSRLGMADLQVLSRRAPPPHCIGGLGCVHCVFLVYLGVCCLFIHVHVCWGWYHGHWMAGCWPKGMLIEIPWSTELCSDCVKRSCVMSVSTSWAAMQYV